MRRASLLLFLAASLALAACGGGDSTTTVTETAPATVPGTTTTETTSPAPTGPSGALSPTGVGPAQQGASTAEVRGLFGDPARTQKGPGCELAPSSPGAIAWTYPLEGGTLVLDFDAASGELTFYRNTSPALETTRGDRVGDSFTSLQGHWGGSLKPLTLGVGATPKAGIWLVKDGGSQIQFEIRGARIAAITGGQIEICE